MNTGTFSDGSSAGLGMITHTQYDGGFIYKYTGTSTPELTFFSHPEGYIEPDNQGNYDYVYQFKDHLGNIRLSYKDVGTSTTPVLDLIEEKNYYPFGLEHKGYNNVATSTSIGQKFTFNGQQFDESLNLNVQEMDWRQYDPTIGRFNVVDGMAELAYDITPYRFGFNNPVFFSDPTGLWEEVDGGYTTDDKDEIARFMGYLKYNEGAEKDYDGMMNFIKEDIAFFESFDKGLKLSTAYVKNGKVTDHSIHRMKNEIAYYEGRTDYLYTREDYEMRNKILADGGNDPISRVLLGWERSGNYQPITASNYIDYVGGEKTARLLTVQSFVDMMGAVSGGPSSVSRSVSPRYLGTRTNQGSLTTRNKISGGSGILKSTTISPKNMNWQQFRQQYSHLYRGKFQGRGTYLKFMSMDYNAMKAGLRE